MSRERIESLFEQALDLDPAERDAFLDRATDGDAALRAEVAAMVAAHERAGGLLERSVSPPDALIDAPLPRDGRIGAYRLLNVLGRGGMGVVYTAERADGQFRRRVAVKVLKGEVDPELAARIVAERQILASLDHPNIARLLDGGVTDDGRPYLVIEHVSGLPIDVYCERMRLTVPERLRLFVTVARAVDHAHRNLVVHRDLKPSNILVSPAGEVKLLDFGIAKLLNPSLAGVDAPITRTDHRVLTPEYASPEQVRGEALTTVSDVYSLGVVLYELLTGRRPYELSGRSLQEMIEAVCERDPERPSTAVGRTRSDADAAVEPEESPRIPPERLRRQLRGDLDAIVMMALRKEPGRRYGSAELMAQDIERHLDGRPVHAHRGTKRYRMRKFVRRHRVTTLAAAGVVLSLLSGALVAAREASRARDARDRAETALAQATEVTDFLLGMFEASDPAGTPSEIVTAADLLRRGALRADELRDQPDVQARMLLTLARANRSLGKLDDGRRLADRAAAALSAHHGPQSPEFADALVELGRIVRDLALYDSARTILETARAVYERTTGPSDPRLGVAIGELASAAIYLGDMPKAKRLRAEAWQLHRSGLGPDDPQSITSLMLYGTVLRRIGQPDSAVAVLREAVDRRRGLGPGHEADLTGDMLQLATTLQTMPDRLDEAEEIFREALAIQRRALGPTHVAVVWPLGSLSEIAEERGDLAEAERLLRESLDVRRLANGERHPSTAGSIGGLAAFLARNGRTAEAETMRRLSIQILTETLGPEHPRTADHMGALAELLIERRSYPEADSLLRRAIAARTAVQGGSHMDLYPLYERQALLFLRTGDFAAAERAIDNALGVMHEGVPDPFSSRLHRIAADVYEATGRTEEAARHRAAAPG